MSPDTPNVLQAMIQVEQVKTRAKTANKLVLEAEKENHAAEKAVEELKRHLQPTLQLETVTRGDRRTRGAVLKQIHGMGTRRYVLSVDDDNEFRSRCE